MSTREFTLTEGTSDKFWKITLEGNKTTVNFGRNGTAGQIQTKEFASTDEAKKNYDKLISEKTKKGYTETAASLKGQSAATVAVTPKAEQPKSDTPKPAKAKAGKKEDDAPALPVASTASPAAPSFDLSSLKVERVILADPSYFHLASWRKIKAEKLPAPRAFNKQACLEAFQNMKKSKRRYQDVYDWAGLNLPLNMSTAEAEFWLSAMCNLDYSTDPRGVAEKLSTRQFKGEPIGIKDINNAFTSRHYMEGEAMIFLRILAEDDALIDWIVEECKRKPKSYHEHSSLNANLLSGFKRFVWPYLPEKQRATIRDAVRPLLKGWPTDPYAPATHYQVAAAIELHDELLLHIQQIQDELMYTSNDYVDDFHNPQFVIFGLNDPAKVEEHFRRLKLRIKNPMHLLGWLAHTETRALDVVVTSINAIGNRDECTKLLDVFCETRAPEVAPAMVEIYLKSKDPRTAREWLDNNPGHTIPGLLAVLANKTPRGAVETSLEILQSLKRRGAGEAIEKSLSAFPADVAKKIRAELSQAAAADAEPLDEKSTPKWLKEALAEAAKLKGKLSPWVKVSDLPPLRVEKRKLNEEQVQAVVLALQVPLEGGDGKEELPRDAYYELMRNISQLLDFDSGYSFRKKEPKVPAVTWETDAPNEDYKKARKAIDAYARLLEDETKRGKTSGTAAVLACLPIVGREFYTQLHRARGDAKEARRMAERGKMRGGVGGWQLNRIVDGRFDQDEKELKELGILGLKEEVEADIKKNPPPKKKTGIQFHPLILALRENADPASLDTFAWRLFEMWLGEGAPSKDKWAFTAVGAFGGDKSVLKLTPMIRAWPGESQHQRAVLGLEILRQIGSDTALMSLNGIAQKLPFKGLKEKANQYMEAIAEEKGLTKAELEDRVVPDCDLDERGGCVLDFGTRKFNFILGPEMKPMVRDEAGTIKPDLPAPNSKDNAELAKAAVDRWKLMKKQIKEVAKIQAFRLEQAMVVGRRWKPADVDTLIVKHPLMTNLARLLLWGGFGAKGKLQGCFRVTEEQDYADIKDGTAKIDGYTEIGLIHPLQLSEADRNAWGQVFSDYNIIPPFPQLGRAVLKLDPKEEKGTEIFRLEKTKLAAPTLVFGLEKMGWQRGGALDGGGFVEHVKAYPMAGVSAVIEYEGCVSMGYIDPNEMLEVKTCFFLKGIYDPKDYDWADHKNKLKLNTVDPIVISETLNDLQQLAAKVTAK